MRHVNDILDTCMADLFPRSAAERREAASIAREKAIREINEMLKPKVTEEAA